MEKVKFLEMPPPLSDSDCSEDDIDDREVLPSTGTDEIESSNAQQTESVIGGLGHRLESLNLLSSNSVEDSATLSRCDHQSTLPSVDRSNSASDARTSDIVTEDDASMFCSTMASIEAGMDVEIGSLEAHDVACLNHDRLLNDEIINAYMRLLQKRKTSIACHFFNSFFIPRLMTAYNYRELKNWTSIKRLKRWGQSMECILDVDLIFLPYFSFVHWSLIVVDLRDDSITHYDSITPVSKRPQSHVKAAMQSIGRYLMDEAKDKKQEDWSERVFRFRLATNVPQQENGSDCGVFLAQYAKRLSLGMPLSFSQGQIYDYRIQMFRELLHDRIF